METLLIFGAINIGAMLFGGAINAGLLKWHQKKTKKSFDELINQLDQRQIQRDNTREPFDTLTPINNTNDVQNHQVETPSENGYIKPRMNSKYYVKH